MKGANSNSESFIDDHVVVVVLLMVVQLNYPGRVHHVRMELLASIR